MKLPGPLALPIIGNCLQFTSNDLSKLFQQFMKFARSYVPIARLWFGPVLVVVLTDPDCIEIVAKHDKLYSRGYLFRKSMEQHLRNGMLSIDGEEWRRHRKIVSGSLHINMLETFVENFAKNSDILANKLKALADGITAQDIAPYIKRCTVDIVIQTSSSLDINAQNGNNDPTLDNISTITDTTTLRIMKPWLLIDWIFNASELGQKYIKAVKCERDKVINEIGRIKNMRETVEKTGENYGKLSLMDLLIQYGDTSKEEVVGEIGTIAVAGAETTCNACGYVLALLADNQHIQERVLQEQQDIFGDEIMRPVRSDDLPRMVYLEQVGNRLLIPSRFSRIVAICLPVPVDTRSKAWNCGRSPVGIVGSNPTGGNDVCLF
jgi:cytochrome P450